MIALWATFRSAVAEAAAKPGALLAQMTVMILNDATWVLFWVIFARRVGTIGGWDVERLLLLQAVLTTAGGLSLGVFANARRIGAMTIDGDLDAVLALPVSPLPFLLLRRIEPVNIGDLAFGIVLFAAVGNPTPTRTLVFIGVVLASATLLTSFLVLTGALAFFAGRNESGDLGFHAMLLLGSYPVDLFAGTVRVLLFTAVPAAFIAAVPARIIDDVDLADVLGLGAVASVFAIAAATTFSMGLRRYTSGSVWTRA